MIKPEQVPDEVLRAFIAAYHDKRMLLSDSVAAALNAWLGAYFVDYGGDEPPFFVLPLTQETRDDD